MASKSQAQQLLDIVEDALEVIDDAGFDAPAHDIHSSNAAFPTLLEKCAALAQQDEKQEPIRAIHHMACTGGTLICKLLSCMPSVTLLSEIDPLSRQLFPEPNAPVPFRPTDFIFAGQVALRPLDDDISVDAFCAALETIHASLTHQGRFLCIRDHTHSHYCVEQDYKTRPNLREILLRVAPTRSVVTVRHPMDSALSHQSNGWVICSPNTLQEYAERYLAFLDAYEGLPVFRYEDFVTSPDAVLEQICDVLALPFTPGAQEMLPVVRMSGDSGRTDVRKICPRPRRAIPEPLKEQAKLGKAYKSLCERLGYDAW